MKRYRKSAHIALFLLLIGLGTLARGAHGQTTAPFTLPPPADATEAMRRSLYAYDPQLPLKAELKPLDDSDVRTRYHLAYDSIHDQRVTAILAIPKHFAAPYPVVLLVHGSGGHKDTSYIALSSEMLTTQGYATLALDTQYHGERVRPDRSGEIHMPDSYTMRDAWVQSVVDMRRAVDYIETRNDLDKSKIGYLGFSQGAMLGGVLGGVEARIACFCLTVPGGGFVNVVKHIDQYPVLKAHWPVKATPDIMKTIEDICNVTDPIYYVGRILPRPLLILVAKFDEIIPPEASAAIVEAAHAKEPDQVKRWASGHFINPAAFFDVRTFFITNLGKRAAVATAAR